MYNPRFSINSAEIFPVKIKSFTILLFLLFSGLLVSAQTIDLTELSQNQPIERDISKSEIHNFSFKVNAGNFCRVTVQQKNADVELKLYGSKGQSFYEINNSNSHEELERASFIAQNTDEIRIEIAFIRKLSGRSEGKDYLINLENLHQANENDLIRVKAERLYDEANRMRFTTNRESRLNSIKVFQESAKLFAEIGDNFGEAFAYYSLGQIQSLLSNFAESRVSFAQAAAIFLKLNLRPQYARAITDQAAVYFFERNFEEAKKLCLEALQIFAEIGNRRGEAEIIGNLGAISNVQDQPRQALDYYFRALPVLKAENDRVQESSILSRIGSVYDDLGEPLNSLDFYEKALKIRRELQDERAEASTLANMSIVLKNLGYYDRATEANERALQIFSQIGQKFGEAVIFNNLGNINHELNNNEKALEFYVKSLNIIREMKLRNNEAETTSNIAGIKLSNGETSAALELFTQSLQIFRELKSKRGEGRALTKIGESHLRNREPQKALEFLNQALPLLREVEDRSWEGSTLFFIGEANRILGNLPTARNSYLLALKIKNELGETSSEAEYLLALAKIEKESGVLAQSQNYIEQAVKILENTRANLSRSNQRSSYFSAKQSFYGFYINLLIDRHKAAPRNGFDTLAFEISEKARARGLLESLGESRFDIRAGVLPEHLEKEKKLRQTINAKESQRLSAVQQNLTTKAAEFEKEISEMLRQYQNLQTEIRQSNPQFATLLNPAPLNLEEIQKQVLDADTVLLEYFLGEEGSFLFFVTQNSLEIFELPSQTLIESQIRQTLENLKARAQTVNNETAAQRTERIKKADLNVEKNLADTSQMLLAPVAAKLQNKRLLVVASGILQYLPFTALTNMSANGNSRYLIENNEIINLPSASIIPLLRQGKRAEKTSKNKIAILADPVFSEDDSRLKILAKQNANENSPQVMRDAKILSPALRSDFSRLRFSRIEAEAISELANANQRFVALDFAANLKAATGENMQKSGIIHFATHGMVNSQFPELSGIVLSLVDEKGKSQEGFLRLHDVYNLRLETDLVVLSACETALGKEVKGEGIVGLTRGFMFAGAPLVAASLWRVEDQATADLMKRFYQRMMIEKMSPAAALRQAQISMLKEKSSAPPFYWAGFTLQGDWK